MKKIYECPVCGFKYEDFGIGECPKCGEPEQDKVENKEKVKEK